MKITIEVTVSQHASILVGLRLLEAALKEGALPRHFQDYWIDENVDVPTPNEVHDLCEKINLL